jgi:hypothetical protein
MIFKGVQRRQAIDVALCRQCTHKTPLIPPKSQTGLFRVKALWLEKIKTNRMLPSYQVIRGLLIPMIYWPNHIWLMHFFAQRLAPEIRAATLDR